MYPVIHGYEKKIILGKVDHLYNIYKYDDDITDYFSQSK